MKIEEKYYRKLNLPSGDLRISITNGCNMKCSYCHNEGQNEFEKIKYMNIDTFKYIIKNAKKYGLNKIRITGGEPLIHPNIEEICEFVKEEGIDNFGINTNGYLSDKLIELCKKEYFKQVVIGLDFFEGKVSKLSPVGKSSNDIKDLIIKLKSIGVNVQIACVYNYNNAEDIYKFVEWCLANKILLKVLEISDRYNDNFNPELFDNFIDKIKNRFDLHAGVTVDLNEYYLYDDNHNKILFFQSHCNRNECSICKNMHMRIGVNGKAKPCIYNSKAEFDLINSDFDENMKKAIINLGNSSGDIL